MEAYAPGAFWFSKLSDFQHCPKYYELKHVQKIDMPKEMSADLEFGSAMHAGLEELLRGGDGEKLFRMYWNSSNHPDMNYTRCDHPTLMNVGEVLLARFKRLHMKNFEPFKLEERIHANLDGIAFEGTPDCLGSYKGIPSVIDFKTASYRYDKRKIVCDAQMPGYAKLAELAYKYAAKQLVYVVLIKDPKAPSIQIVTHQLTDSALSSTIQNVVDTCRDIQDRKVFPMNTKSCLIGTRVCPMFAKCFPEGANDE